MPAISVLLPCFNAAETLLEALDSLACQTLTDFQVVAVEDGSTDSTLEILQDWAKGDQRLEIVTQAHSGIIGALNAGLAACRAPLVARLDADDRAHPERLERQAAYLQAHPEMAVVGCRVTGFPAGQVREGLRVYLEWQNSLLADADIRREIFVESPLAHPSVAFRRDWVVQAGGYQEHGWPEDYDLWLRLYNAGARFEKLPETLLEWREGPERLTRVDERYSLENFLRAKAHYLALGPLAGRDAVFLWGAGIMGRRLGKHLRREGLPLAAYFDIDPHKIGGNRRGLPVLPPEALQGWWQHYQHPALLATVGTRGARPIVRARLNGYGLCEGQDWWCAA